MAITCPSPKFTKSSASVSRSDMQAAMDNYLQRNKGRVIKFPLRLYVTNEADVINVFKRSAPKLVFDSADPADVTDTDVINSGTRGCEFYQIKVFDKDDFKKLNAGASFGTSSRSGRDGIRPMGSERSPFREPDIRLAMTRDTWTEVGVRAGWIKTAQAVNSAQVQKDMDTNVQNQKAEAQKAEQAQQGLADLIMKEQALNDKKKDVERRVADAQRAGKGQDQSVMAPLLNEQYEIAEQLQPIQKEIEKYKELNSASAKNPGLVEGVRLAQKASR